MQILQPNPRDFNLRLRWLRDCPPRRTLAKWFAVGAIFLLPASLAACGNDVAAGATGNMNTGGVQGDARAGANEIAQIGCGGCHSIPGITGADGLVGPPLTQIGRRLILAGLLRNTSDN